MGITDPGQPEAGSGNRAASTPSRAPTMPLTLRRVGARERQASRATLSGWHSVRILGRNFRGLAYGLGQGNRFSYPALTLSVPFIPASACPGTSQTMV